jgi:hypothetical protein
LPVFCRSNNWSHQLIGFWFSFHMVINIHKNSQLQEGKVFVVTNIFHCLVQASYFYACYFHTHTHTYTHIVKASNGDENLWKCPSQTNYHNNQIVCLNLINHNLWTQSTHTKMHAWGRVPYVTLTRSPPGSKNPRPSSNALVYSWFARTIQIFESDLFVAKKQRVLTLLEDQITTLKHDLHLGVREFLLAFPIKARILCLDSL